MGQCFYVAKPWRPEEGREPLTLHFPSEAFIDLSSVGRILGRHHHINTTVGVWFYERDLWDKEKLRQDLLALVEYVCGPEFDWDSPEFRKHMKKRLEEREELHGWRYKEKLP